MDFSKIFRSEETTDIAFVINTQNNIINKLNLQNII